MKTSVRGGDVNYDSDEKLSIYSLAFGKQS